MPVQLLARPTHLQKYALAQRLRPFAQRSLPFGINGGQNVHDRLFLAMQQRAELRIAILDQDGQDGHCFDYLDTGKGVKDDELEKIFERFYRLDTDRSNPQGGVSIKM